MALIKRAVLTVVISLAASPMQAQVDPAAYETVLLPVAADDLQGAFGSLWVTKFTIHNGLSRDIESPADIRSLGECFFPPCDPVVIEPGRSTDPPIYRTTPGSLPGGLLYLRRDISAQVAFSLRVQDVSRQAQTWGTEIPVVREQDLHRGPLWLLNVPVGDRFRQTLRIYDPLPHVGCRSVRVRLFDPNSGTTHSEETVQLARDEDCNQTFGSEFPDAAEWHNLAARAGIATGNVGVEITPIGDFAIWAFVSVTNNDTQHVTTITPQ